MKAVVVALGYNNQIGWGLDGCMSWALLIHERICSGFESSCLVDIQMKLTFAGICMVCRWVDASEQRTPIIDAGMLMLNRHLA